MMSNKEDLERFLTAQERNYHLAYQELEAGRKRSHWMWYIFPQISGLGFSTMSNYYALKDLKEAQAFLNHPVLGPKLIKITKVLLQSGQDNATVILGSPDDLKLRSSMTLFSQIPGAPVVFQQVLDRFFGGQPDSKTMKLLGIGNPSSDR